MADIVPLYRWEVLEYFWGAVVRECRMGQWVSAFLKPKGTEVDLRGLQVEIHENGIEFF